MHSLLDKIAADQTAAGEVCQMPATTAQLDVLVEEAKSALDAKVPEAFLEFLRHTNGLDYNGLVLYGASQSEEIPGPGGFWQGVVAANRLWRDAPGRENYLVIGETGIDLVTVGLDGTSPCLRDKISDDANQTFADVAQMLEFLLQTHL